YRLETVSVCAVTASSPKERKYNTGALESFGPTLRREDAKICLPRWLHHTPAAPVAPPTTAATAPPRAPSRPLARPIQQLNLLRNKGTLATCQAQLRRN